MEQAITIGLDIAKHVFDAHGADAAGHVLFRKRLTRAKLLGFLAAQAPCVVAMEACAGSHYWGREIGKLGHAVRLIPPAYVKPFVKRQKNDAADAEAICEAAQRPSMRFVPIRTRSSRPTASCFGRVIFWCASARSASMRYVGTSPNTATFFLRALRVPQLRSLTSRIRIPLCQRVLGRSSGC